MEGIAFNAQRLPLPQPEKPLDDVTGSPSRTTNEAPPKMLFGDMVMGDKPIPPPMPKRDLIAEKLMTITFKDGNRLLPQV